MSADLETEHTRIPHRASPWRFFLLLFFLSLPLYALGASGDRLPLATFLPMSALMAFIPMITALVLVLGRSGAREARQLLARALDYRRIKGIAWVLVALLLVPIVVLLEYGVLRLEGRALPDAQFFPVTKIVAFTLMFFIGAIGEELGWQGYAYVGLKNGRNALDAALIIGLIWALWHVIPFAQLDHGGEWILWHGLSMVALRVIIVWLFENARLSVFIAAVFHTMTNMAWGVFPNYASYYDPFVMLVILALVAGIVVAVWGPSTLVRCRHSRPT